jgi:hypothetical protein
LERHARICQKVFCTKRRAFDSSEARMGGLDCAAVSSRAPPAGRRGGGGGAKRGAGAGGGGDNRAIPLTREAAKPKWAKQSEQLRAAMRAVKGGAGGGGGFGGGGAAVEQEEDDR